MQRYRSNAHVNNGDNYSNHHSQNMDDQRSHGSQGQQMGNRFKIEQISGQESVPLINNKHGQRMQSHNYKNGSIAEQ